MITLQELCEYLDAYLDSAVINDYCPNGLQVEGRKEVRSIATAVSASLATIELAVEEGVDALVVHHGMFWKGDSFCVTGVKRRKLELLIENGISLIGYHLPLDYHQEVGNNWKAARDLGWQDLEEMDSGRTGKGVIGYFDPIPVDQFREELESYYEHAAFVALGGKEEVSSAALISGGAHSYIDEALRAGVDCFITGSYDEPIWHKAFEEGIHFFALGHSNTERIGPMALGRQLEKEFDLKHQFIDVPNPF